MSSRHGRLLEGATALLLFVFGLALCLHHGRVGLMPLDQSIVFDGGWRLLCGQVPFRDFTTPAGLVPIALQAAFFRAFGVSWFVYCLHAAIFNGLFCILAFRLLRRLGTGRLAAAFYALLSGVVFYPPFGVPYMDQHAFFFSLAVVVALVEAGASDRGRSQARWLGALPWLLAAAYLSKPIPSVYCLPLLGLVPLLLDRDRLRSAAASLLSSSAALAAGLGAAILSVDRGLLLEFLVTRPGREGRGRLLALLEPTAFAGQAAELLRAAEMMSLVPTILGAILLLAIRPGNRERPSLPSWFRPGLALSLLGVCAAFVMVTDNQGENGIPFVFLAAGLVHAEVLGRGRPGRGRAAAAMVAVLAASSAVDAARFERRVNVTRMVHELDGVASAAPAEARALPPALRFLEWKLHPFYHFGPGDLGEVVSFLRREEGSIYVFGDLTILYALTGRPSAGRTLWLHSGLTLPEPHEPGFADWETCLVDDLERRHVRFVVRESRQTYNGLRLSSLPRLAAYIEARRVRRLSFGPIDVIELACPGCATAAVALRSPRTSGGIAELADQAQAERRKSFRMGMALPVRVTGFSDEGAAWEEVTGTEDVSQGGLSLRLGRRVELGQVLALSLPMPKRLREFDLNDSTYRVYGLVRGIVRKEGKERVGVMFFGKYPPRGFHERPGARYLLPSDSVAGMPVPPELRQPAPQSSPPPPSPLPPSPPSPPEAQPAPPPATAAFAPPSPSASGQIHLDPMAPALHDRRSTPRVSLFVNFTLQLVDEWGTVLQEELTVADNLSRGGAHVMTSLEFAKSDVIQLEESGGGFATRAEVRGVKRGRDGIIRLHLRFLDGQTPDRLLGIKA